MSVKAEMEKILTDRFSPMYLELRDDSHRHIGHAGHDGRGESHFHLIMVSDKFDGLSRVDRQRMVNDALAEFLKSRVHALSMELRNIV